MLIPSNACVRFDLDDGYCEAVTDIVSSLAGWVHMQTHHQGSIQYTRPFVIRSLAYPGLLILP